MSNDAPSKKPDDRALSRRNMLLGTSTLVAAAATLNSGALAQAQKAAPAPAAPSGRKPNILVIFGDDIGQTNISAYSFGLMGYKTPNIDRIAREGMMFTDYYAEQSCTAGRSRFITGQCTLRTGLSKVGIPGATLGLQTRDGPSPSCSSRSAMPPASSARTTSATATNSCRRCTASTSSTAISIISTRRGSGSRDLSARSCVPASPRSARRATRKASDRDDPTEQPRWGRVGKQTIEDTGPLTKKRMETIDDETSAAALDFIQRQARANTPFFCWFNSTRMHFRTHVRESHRDKPGLTSRTEYADGMIEHDAVIGTILKAVDDLGIGNDTIVIYTTDNGPHQNSWPDAGTTPFRSEKNTNWEGAFRVPCMVRWPGRIQSGSISNDIVSALDWLPTLMAAAGEPEIKDKLLKGHQVGSKTYKVHLDGYNQLPYLTGQQERGARKEFVYFNDDGDLVALRYENWKFVFEEQRATGTMRIWAEPFTKLRVPKLFDLRSDPYERADVTSNTFYDFFMSDGAGPFIASQAIVAPFLATFKEYPPSQRPSSFSIDQLVEKMQRSFETSQ